MQTVVIHSYSKFFDAKTGVQFNEILDPSTGNYIGAAEVPDSLASHFAANPAYQLLSKEEYSALVTGGSSARRSVQDAEAKAEILTYSIDKDVVPPASPKR